MFKTTGSSKPTNHCFRANQRARREKLGFSAAAAVSLSKKFDGSSRTSPPSASIEQQKVTMWCRWKVTVVFKSSFHLFRLLRFSRILDNNSRAVQGKTPSRKVGKVLLSPQTPHPLRLEATSYGTVVSINITRDVFGPSNPGLSFLAEIYGPVTSPLGTEY